MRQPIAQRRPNVSERRVGDGTMVHVQVGVMPGGAIIHERHLLWHLSGSQQLRLAYYSEHGVETCRSVLKSSNTAALSKQVRHDRGQPRLHRQHCALTNTIELNILFSYSLHDYTTSCLGLHLQFSPRPYRSSLLKSLVPVACHLSHRSTLWHI